MSVNERHLRLLAARCLGRRNDYALQREDGRYVRVGSAVTLDALSRHVAGVKTMATYVIDEAVCVSSRSSMPIAWMGWCSCSVSSVG